MRNDPIISAKLEFARSAAFRRDQKRFFKEAEKKHEGDRAERIEDDVSDLMTSAVVLASEKDITLYYAEGDLYRTATTEALMDNERQLTEVQKRLDDMLTRAYVLPDGRRVFKSRDGQHVYDEHGLELGRNEIDPDLIEDWRPVSDDYLVDRDAKLELLSQRQELLTYEERMRMADERVEAGNLTKAELDDLSELRRTTAPKEVLARMPGHKLQPPETETILRPLPRQRMPGHKLQPPETTPSQGAAAKAENLDFDLGDAAPHTPRPLGPASVFRG
jgi:hypothetical protein